VYYKLDTKIKKMEVKQGEKDRQEHAH